MTISEIRERWDYELRRPCEGLFCGVLAACDGLHPDGGYYTLYVPDNSSGEHVADAKLALRRTKDVFRLEIVRVPAAWYDEPAVGRAALVGNYLATGFNHVDGY